MSAFSALVLILIPIVCYCDADYNEPISFKLYDILGKVANVEVKIEKWEKEREQFQETVLSILEHRKVEMRGSFDVQNENLKRIHEEYAEIKDQISNTSELIGKIDAPIVAFNAYTATGGSYHENKVLVFPNVLLNEGGGYDNGTGYFTAPAAGLYHLSAHVCHHKGNYMVVAIVHGDVTIALTTEYESTEYSCSSVSAPVMMESGEYVFLKSAYSKNFLYADTKYRWPSFSGYLVHKNK